MKAARSYRTLAPQLGAVARGEVPAGTRVGDFEGGARLDPSRLIAVDCDIWIEKEDGAKTIVGDATVSLPLR